MDESARTIVGNFCTACNRRFASRNAYHQHRTSAYLIGTACYALHNQNSELVASRRGNVSTAILRSTRSVRRGAKDHVRAHMYQHAKYGHPLYIYALLLIFRHIPQIDTKTFKICTPPGLDFAGRPGPGAYSAYICKSPYMVLLCIFLHIFVFFAYIAYLICFYIFCIFNMFLHILHI